MMQGVKSLERTIKEEMEKIEHEKTNDKKLLKKISNKRVSAVDLFQFGLWMILVAAIISGAVAAYSYSSTKTDAMTMMQTVQNLAIAARDTRTVNGYQADINAEIIAANAVPDNIIIDGSSGLSNPWGGDINIRGDGANFSIGLTEVPEDTCMQLAQSVPIGILRSIGKGSGTSYAAGTEKINLVTSSEAKSLCDSKQIYWSTKE